MFNQHFRYMYIVLIEHTCITQNVLILICVLILLCQILVVYYRANFLAMFSAYITGQKSGLAPLTPNKIQVNQPHSCFSQASSYLFSPHRLAN